LLTILKSLEKRLTAKPEEDTAQETVQISLTNAATLRINSNFGRISI